MENSDINIIDKYQKKTQIEHILCRPDTYIGSINIQEEMMWIYENNNIKKKLIEYVPGLYKIFDEILVNAFDHWRNFPNIVDEIRINIDKENNKITVINNGPGIDVVEHPTYNVYIPEMLFGELLTSTNYNDNIKRTTGGRNGYGAKLTNIFSTFFSIETIDLPRKLKFYQEYKNNLSEKSDPVIESINKIKTAYTKIEFIPDLKKFNLNNLTDDIISLLVKRIYDIAGLSNKLKVYYNNIKLEINNFKKYIELYDFSDSLLGVNDDTSNELDNEVDKINSLSIYEENERWKCYIKYIPDIGFEQISFVNGICTYNGGNHVDYIVNQIIKKLEVVLLKKNKDLKIKNSLIKDQMVIFIDSIIENPVFTSQTKESLKSKVTEFGSTIDLSDKFIKKLSSSGIIENLINLSKLKEDSILKKTDGKKTTTIKGIPKLEDANWAGDKKKSIQCKLILTEGDSAKALAMAGRSVIGSDKYGVFPLKGKLLNVRDATSKQILENEEIINLKKILGLQHNKNYNNLSDLRYGGIIIMCDQDSVTDDTPLLLKIKNEIVIKRIDSICEKWDTYNNKYCGHTDYEVWTDKGWTKIKKVIKHRVYKKIYRVITNTGVVDVTEDHSLLDNNSQIISPKDVSSNTILLNSFPKLFTNYDYKIKFDELMIMSLFFINGSCNKISICDCFCRLNIKNWWIENDDLDLLKYIKNYLEDQYLIKFKIKKEFNKQKLYLDDNSIKSNIFIDKYIKLFYNPTKVIPKEILNSNILIREKFLNILFNYNYSFCSDDKICIQSVYLLLKSLNYDISIYYNHKKGIYSLDKRKYNYLNIIDLGYKDEYVYDLETENHHFQAGIGEIIVHNTDGFHIKGLLINFFHYFWPSLLLFNNFINTLATPIVKATHKKEILSFYNFNDYLNWKMNNDTKGFIIKYYKGLGTSTKNEAKEYFTDIDKKLISYHYDKSYDNNDNIEDLIYKKHNEKTYNNGILNKYEDISTESITLAFEKTRSNDRKIWLKNYNKDNIININEKSVPISDFINKELIHFSNDDINRSIPHIMDGLKPSTRKILFSAFMRKLFTAKDEIKVSQLSGYVSDKTCYHHGEMSLNAAIIGMAQNFVGSNNINLLYPSGQFGTRLTGKDYASPRYIYTYLEELTKYIFRKEDEPILKYIDDDGISVEPECYYPILPMILVNGSEGIGTGFSTYIPQYNVLDIIDNIYLLMENKELKKLKPYYKNFKGNIEEVNENDFVVRGVYHRLKKDTIQITELPVGIWTLNYKEFLEKKSEKSKTQLIESYKSNYTDDTINFTIVMNEELIDKYINNNSLEQKLKLTKSIKQSNMHIYNHQGIIKKYHSVNEIIEEFYEVRLNVYEIRKKYNIEKYSNELNILEWKIKFINDILNNKIVIYKQKKDDIINKLVEYSYPKLENDTYDYLTNMQLFSLTYEKIEELEKKYKEKNLELEKIKTTSNIEQWKHELHEFIIQYNVWINKNKL